MTKINKMSDKKNVSKKQNYKETETNSFETQKKIDKDAEIAFHYGFSLKKVPEITKADIEAAKHLSQGEFLESENKEHDTRLPLQVEEKVAILREYHEKWANLPQPVMVYFKGDFKGNIKKEHWVRFSNMEILGTTKSIAEVILIHTAFIILKDLGYKNIRVEINSIGDKESINNFYRDLVLYYRKNIESICHDCRQKMKKDIFDVLYCKKNKCVEISKEAPKSMAYLSDQSRIHFMEILEYLEKLGIEYKINDHLFGNRKYCTETIFEIINYKDKDDDKETLAVGMRYNGLAKKIGFKKDVPAASLSIFIKPKNVKTIIQKIKTPKKPLIYFIQLGYEAKLESIQIIENLRRAKIAVYHTLAKDKIGGQVSIVEKMRLPYAIIMGKKEALEKSVIVRLMSNYSQETVPIENLTDYVRRMIK